jgi:hypothetical protein
LYLDGLKMSEDNPDSLALANHAWNAPEEAPAFSYRINHLWGIRAEAMGEVGPEFESLKLGSKNSTEDDFDPIFSVNFAVVRHF